MTSTDTTETTPTGPWWHAFGRVRDEWGGIWQLTVVSPSTVAPAEAAALGAESWGPYLTSWDHEPTDEEKEAVTPEEFRDEDGDDDDD